MPQEEIDRTIEDRIENDHPSKLKRLIPSEEDGTDVWMYTHKY